MSEYLPMQNAELAKSMSHSFPDLTGETCSIGSDLICLGIPLHSNAQGQHTFVKHVTTVF